MRIVDLQRRLTQILEVPRSLDVWQVGREMFIKFPSEVLAEITSRGATFLMIWEDFEEKLEQQGRDLISEVEQQDFDLFSSLTTNFFSSLTEGVPPNSKVRDWAEEEQMAILEAIQIVKQELYP